MVILHHLLAAFSMVDHCILLDQLRHMNGIVQNWFWLRDKVDPATDGGEFFVSLAETVKGVLSNSSGLQYIFASLPPYE